MQLPSFLKSGEVARLFPVISESSKEQRAASIFLSVLSAVPSFAEALLAQTGQRIGARTVINTFTEVVFASEQAVSSKDRPDGLILLSSGSRQWTALLKAKIANGVLTVEQTERYVKLARDNQVDAVITISNQFTSLPTHCPVAIQKSLTRKVALFHFSWSAVLTSAVLLHEQGSVIDTEQAFLLRELIRFLSHPSAGLTRYTSMPGEWSGAIDLVQAGGKVTKQHAVTIVSGWYQEIRDLTLLMSRLIGCPIRLRLARSHQADAELRLREDADRLCRESVLDAVLEIPNAASPLRIVADLRARAVRVSMTIDAPKDRKTNGARTNWLLRQLRDVKLDRVSVALIWASRAPDTLFPLKALLDAPKLAETATVSSELRAFEIVVSSSNAQRFIGRRTVIEEIEQLAPRFYEEIGQHLRAWKPQLPKPLHSIGGEPKRTKPEPAGTLQPGNAHNSILDIPDFLRRDAGGSGEMLQAAAPDAIDGGADLDHLMRHQGDTAV